MDRPWLAQYPAGVPAQIDADARASLQDMLAASCARLGHGKRVANVLQVAAWIGPGMKNGVKAVVVRADPALTEADLLAHTKLHLTGYKVPRLVEFRNEPLPKTTVGKIQRRELRDAAPAPAPAEPA